MAEGRLASLARRMRGAPVLYERRLWALLRSRRLAGLKFRRQVVVEPYVVDFVCLRYRLVVEADGPFHDAARDQERDDWLTSQGFYVLRFSNSQIESRDWEVVAAIEAAARRALTAP